jgi:hypothetical protein
MREMPALPEMDAFERRLAREIGEFADRMPTAVDAMAVALRVTGERPAPSWLPVRLASRRARFLLVAAVLALLAGAVGAGAWLLHRQDPPMIRNHGITLLTEPFFLGRTQALTGSDGVVWALTDSGLIRIDSTDGAVRTWTATDDLGFDADEIYSARGGGVWLRVGMNVFRRFDGQRLGNALVLPDEAVGWVSEMAEAPDGTLWLGTSNGRLFRCDGSTWSRVPDVPVAMVSPGGMAFAPDGTLWVASTSGFPAVARFDGTTWTSYPLDAQGKQLPSISSLAPGPHGGVWAGAGTGLAHFDGTAWTVIDGSMLGAANEYWRPAVGPDGSVWAAAAVFGDGDQSDRDLVVHLEDGTWRHWETARGLPEPQEFGTTTISVAVTGAGPYVIKPAAAYRLVGDQWQQAWQTGLPVGPVRHVTPGVGQEAWWWTFASVGDTTQLWHHTAAGAQSQDLPAGVTTISDLALQPDGALWMASNAGTAVLRDDTWTVVDRTPGVAIAIARDGVVWALATDRSLRSIHPDGAGWAVTVLPDSATGGPVDADSWEVSALSVDGDGAAWFNGGSVAGKRGLDALARFSGGHWQSVRPDGVPLGTEYDTVLAAPDGTIWVTMTIPTPDGGCCLPGFPSVAHFAGGRWTAFGSKDGLPDLSASGMALTPDGAVWLSMTDGLYRFDAASKTWRLAIEGHWFGPLVAAPDGALWSNGRGLMRIGEPLQ